MPDQVHQRTTRSDGTDEILGTRRVILGAMASHPTARHLLRAKDLADAWYFEQLTVADLARVAGLSRAHFSDQFRRAFGEAPHAYLLTRRLERGDAADDRSVGRR